MSKWRNLHWNQRWFLLLLFLCNFFANNDVSLQLCKCPPLWIGEQCEISVLTARKICLPKPTTPNSTNATTTSTTTTTTSTPLFKPQVLTNVDPRCPGAHEYCAEFEGCPDVPADGVCLCQRNYDFVNGTCLKSLFSIYFLFPFSLKKTFLQELSLVNTAMKHSVAMAIPIASITGANVTRTRAWCLAIRKTLTFTIHIASELLRFKITPTSVSTQLIVNLQ